jgi:magnesium transporter
VLTTKVIRPDGVVEHDGLVLEALGEDDCLVWVDSTGPDEDDLRHLGEAFPLHELAVEDVSRHGQRAKLEIYPDHAFLVAYARASDGDLSEVDVFIGPGWLVSVREKNEHGEMFELDVVLARYRRLRDLDRGAGFLLYVLLDALVDGYFDAIEESEDALETVEEVLFDLGPPPDGALQRDLLELRKGLVMFRRRVVPLRDVVLSILRGEVEWIEREAIIYFQDVLDHLLRVIDQIDTQRELMGNVVDASLALSGNRMNQVMKKMTSWGAILIVATLVAGIYGMNFRYMPELDWHYGYFFALGTMLASTGGLYLYFKRKSWL